MPLQVYVSIQSLVSTLPNEKDGMSLGMHGANNRQHYGRSSHDFLHNNQQFKSPLKIGLDAMHVRLCGWRFYT